MSRNPISFGDGLSSVEGAASVSSLRWTNNAMVLPLDGGRTWSAPTNNIIRAINTQQLDDGEIVALQAWNTTYQVVQPISFLRWQNPTGNGSSTDSTVTLPFSSQLLSHRSLIELDDGILLSSFYGRKNGSKDFLLWQRNFDLNAGNATSVTVPEPVAMTMVLTGALIFFSRMSRKTLLPSL